MSAKSSPTVGGITRLTRRPSLRNRRDKIKADFSPHPDASLSTAIVISVTDGGTGTTSYPFIGLDVPNYNDDLYSISASQTTGTATPFTIAYSLTEFTITGATSASYSVSIVKYTSTII